MTSKVPARSCADVDETALSYAEIKALCAGDPRIREKMELDVDVSRLRVLKNEHDTQHYRLEDAILKHYPSQIAATTARIAGISADADVYKAHKEKCVEIVTVNGAASVTHKFPGMTINGVTHSEKEPAAKALLESCRGVTGKEETPVGEYMGFKLALSYEPFSQKHSLLIRGSMTYSIDLGTDAFGNIKRINNALDDLEWRVEHQQTELENLNVQMAAAKDELAKPFPQERELIDKETRLTLLNTELNLGGGDVADALDAEADDRGEFDGDAGRGNIDEDRDEDIDDEDYADEPEPAPRRTAAKSEPSFVGNIISRGKQKRENAQTSGKTAGKDVEH